MNDDDCVAGPAVPDRARAQRDLGAAAAAGRTALDRLAVRAGAAGAGRAVVEPERGHAGYAARLAGRPSRRAPGRPGPGAAVTAMAASVRLTRLHLASRRVPGS